ncbi:MAG: glycoside hydrolase family 3 C-terminal domain-containing protein, partial [Cyclobacteriaceae bacterium]
MLESARAGKLVGEKGAGGDRSTLKLPPEDEALLNELASVNKNTVVTYVGGSAIDMSDWEDKAPAIVFAWYAGMEGGKALANILYGKVNPSGKLPFTIAANEEDYPEFNPYTDNITYGYYHGYTLFEKEDKPIAYPFGFGLSYTSYKYSDLRINDANLSVNDTLGVSVILQNTGAVAGEEVVQLYVGFGNSSVDRPVKLLRGFDKIYLNAGEKQEVVFSLPVKEMAYYDPAAKNWKVEQMEYELYVGGSSGNVHLLQDKFRVTNVAPTVD